MFNLLRKIKLLSSYSFNSFITCREIRRWPLKSGMLIDATILFIICASWERKLFLNLIRKSFSHNYPPEGGRNHRAPSGPSWTPSVSPINTWSSARSGSFPVCLTTPCLRRSSRFRRRDSSAASSRPRFQQRKVLDSIEELKDIFSRWLTCHRRYILCLKIHPQYIVSSSFSQKVQIPHLIKVV